MSNPASFVTLEKGSTPIKAHQDSVYRLYIDSDGVLTKLLPNGVKQPLEKLDGFSATNPDLLLDTLAVGDITGGNYVDVGADGTMTLHGNATAFTDLETPLIGRRLASEAGKADYDWDNLEVLFGSGGSIAVLGDVVGFTRQIPHTVLLGSPLDLHLHWFQTDATAREFTVQYQLQSPGDAENTEWTTVVVDTSVNNVFPYVSGTLYQITTLATIPTTGLGISSQLTVKFARTDSVAGILRAKSIDTHIEISRLGSPTLYA